MRVVLFLALLVFVALLKDTIRAGLGWSVSTPRGPRWCFEASAQRLFGIMEDGGPGTSPGRLGIGTNSVGVKVHYEPAAAAADEQSKEQEGD
jgi:hypothetical protein